jgi:hypothetical protein
MLTINVGINLKNKQMPIKLEISYFNTFIISNSATSARDAIEGIWYVEESRIKGKYNGTQVDYGVKAYMTDTDYEPQRKSNELIYSGIYNKKTGVNRTNEFPTGSDITRALDPRYGSIQKLFAEDNSLNIFQEAKVHSALIDKDAIYTATGSQLIATSNKIIGSITPYLHANGISQHPETHSYHNGRQYFADKDRGAILRLGRDGITEISEYGMKTFSREALANADFIRGMYDARRSEYVLSIGNTDETDSDISIGKKFNTLTEESDEMKFITMGFYEKNNGWTSIYSYKPSFGFSYKNNFFTYNTYNLWRHYSQNVPRCNFYGSGNDSAYIQLVINDQPSNVKNFLTVNYEGSHGWTATDINSEKYGPVNGLAGYTETLEEAYDIPVCGSQMEGDDGISVNIGFINKEGEYNAGLINKNNDFYHDFEFSHTSGLKGHYLDLTMSTRNTNGTTAAQEGPISLFTVSSEAKMSSV